MEPIQETPLPYTLKNVSPIQVCKHSKKIIRKDSILVSAQNNRGNYTQLISSYKHYQIPNLTTKT